MITFVLILVFIAEYLKYCLGLKLFFKEKIQRFWLLALALGIYIFLITGNKEIFESEIILIMFVLVIAVVFFSMGSKLKNRIIQSVISIFIITCLDGFTEVPVRYFLKSYKGNIPSSVLEYLICSIISLHVLMIIYFIKKFSILNQRKLMKFIRNWMYFFVTVMGIFLLITISGLDFTNSYITNKKVSLFITVLAVISQLSVLVLSMFMVYIKNANEKMEELIETESKLRDMYIKYHKDQLAREEDTRRYRHDLGNHLVCLSELVNSKNIKAANEYIEKMQGTVHYIQKKSFYVGDEILDAVLNYYLPMLGEDVQIQITGKNDKEPVIDSVDLCTVFSNLIQNSIEELTKHSILKKFLKVNVHSGREYFQIEVINSMSSDDQKTHEMFLRTKKQDKRNHGFGLRNVKEIVEKNGGKIEIKIEDNEFTAKVVFKKQNITVQ